MFSPRACVVAICWSVFSTSVFAEVGPAKEAADYTASTVDGWQVVDTPNFRVCAIVPQVEAVALAARCERFRTRIMAKWLPNAVQPWSPRCQVVLHPTADSYLAEVGPGQTTAGASLLEFEGDAIATRRIDLRADHPHGYSDALAHEMTHVAIAETFTVEQIPRWADEGMAVLSDSATKQRLHLADLMSAREQGQAFRVGELLLLAEYPAPERTGAFYGQSASVVKYLVERGTPERFVRFVQQAGELGYDVALNENYGIATLADLEAQWLAHLSTPAAQVVTDDIHAEIKVALGREP